MGMNMKKTNYRDGQTNGRPDTQTKRANKGFYYTYVLYSIEILKLRTYKFPMRIQLIIL